MACAIVRTSPLKHDFGSALGQTSLPISAADAVAADNTTRLYYNRLLGPARGGGGLTLKAGFNGWSIIDKQPMQCASESPGTPCCNLGLLNVMSWQPASWVLGASLDSLTPACANFSSGKNAPFLSRQPRLLSACCALTGSNPLVALQTARRSAHTQTLLMR